MSAQINKIWLKRAGGENDPCARAVVWVEDSEGNWFELGWENVHSNFSTCWHLPQALDNAAHAVFSPEEGHPPSCT